MTVENQVEGTVTEQAAVAAPTMRVQYNEVERKAVKNLSTSISILKADIKKLESINSNPETTAEVIAVNTAKIQYKQDRIAEKTAKMEEYKAGASLVEVAPRAPRAKKEKVAVDHTVPVTDATDNTVLGTAE